MSLVSDGLSPRAFHVFEVYLEPVLGCPSMGCFTPTPAASECQKGHLTTAYTLCITQGGTPDSHLVLSHLKRTIHQVAPGQRRQG